jgi:Na+/H+ antiporter NhaD/arsenite permease-like protein
MRGKTPFASKTIWLGLLTSLISVVSSSVPQASEFIEGNWNTIGLLLGGVIIVLRGLTGRPLTLSGADN